jgi:hypothetical protein
MYKRLQKLSGYAKRLTQLEDTLLVLGQRAVLQADEVGAILLRRLASTTLIDDDGTGGSQPRCFGGPRLERGDTRWSLPNPQAQCHGADPSPHPLVSLQCCS